MERALKSRPRPVRISELASHLWCRLCTPLPEFTPALLHLRSFVGHHLLAVLVWLISSSISERLYQPAVRAMESVESARTKIRRPEMSQPATLAAPPQSCCPDRHCETVSRSLCAKASIRGRAVLPADPVNCDAINRAPPWQFFEWRAV